MKNHQHDDVERDGRQCSILRPQQVEDEEDERREETARRSVLRQDGGSTVRPPLDLTILDDGEVPLAEPDASSSASTGFVPSAST
jgi:hypothetical protein